MESHKKQPCGCEWEMYDPEQFRRQLDMVEGMARRTWWQLNVFLWAVIGLVIAGNIVMWWR